MESLINEYKMTGNKNLFEEVIDKMMLQNFDEKFREKILEMSKSEKRMAILSLLDKDRNLFLKIRSLVNGNRVSKTEHLKDVILFLREYVKIEPGERKRLGQVFTPLELAKDMVNLIDKYDDDFWRNPNHKVLDSSGGFGTFLILAAYKFMSGLSEWEPDEEKRFKWIVENCLYYGDIDPKSVFLWLCLIDPHDEHETNTYWGDFLSGDFDKHAKEVWGVEKWSAIIQNPPYNDDSDNRGSAHVLWDKFCLKSITMLVDDGYLVMVHPSGWRAISGGFDRVKSEMIRKDILYLEIHNEKDGIKNFGAETRYDIYLLRNTNTDEIETDIVCQSGKLEKVNIKKMKFIPNDMFNDVIRLVANSEESQVNVLYDCSYHHQKNYISNSEDGVFKYPCIYTVKNGDVLKLKYSSRNDRGHFNIPKLVWSNGRIISVGSFIDRNGDYALNQFSYAIVDDPNILPYIKKAFDSPKFRKLMECCSVSNMSIDRKVIATFRKDFWKEFI